MNLLLWKPELNSEANIALGLLWLYITTMKLQTYSHHFIILYSSYVTISSCTEAYVIYVTVTISPVSIIELISQYDHVLRRYDKVPPLTMDILRSCLGVLIRRWSRYAGVVLETSLVMPGNKPTLIHPIIDNMSLICC